MDAWGVTTRAISIDARLRRWVENMGLRVPDEVGIAHVDIDGASPMTGVNQNAEMVAAAAIDLLVGQIHRNDRGIPSFPKVVLIEGTWVEGDSVMNADKKPGR